jgi:hypothetical protein
MTTADYLPFGAHRSEVPSDRDPIRLRLYALWVDLFWIVEHALSLEDQRSRSEFDNEQGDLIYLIYGVDEALQNLARLIEVLQMGHQLDWTKIGPNGSAPPYFIRGGTTIGAHELLCLSAHPLDPPERTDPVRFLLNSGKEYLVRLDEDTTEYRRIRRDGGVVADALTRRMNTTARNASAVLARAIELLLLGHTIDTSKDGPTVEQLRTFKLCGETVWIAARDPTTLCKMLRPLDYGVHIRFPDRKWQLFALACVRRISGNFRDDRTLGFIDTTERYADGDLTEDELNLQRRKATEPANPDHEPGADSRTEYGFQALVAARLGNAESAIHAADMARAAADDPAIEQFEQVGLVREVFGNPYRTAPPDQCWLTWRGGTVEILASGIYEDRAFDRMPILGDALEDAGCTNIDILDHCRGPHKHVRGCWVIDLLIGKHFHTSPQDEGNAS